MGVVVVRIGSYLSACLVCYAEIWSVDPGIESDRGHTLMVGVDQRVEVVGVHPTEWVSRANKISALEYLHSGVEDRQMWD